MIDNLLLQLKARFSGIVDKRPGLQVQYSLADVLMSGVALFSLKDSSLLQFITRFKERSGNLKRLFHVKKCPGDTALRQILDEVESSQLLPILGELVNDLDKHKHLEGYNVLGNFRYIAIDGTTHFSSHEIHCANCLVKNHRDGTKTYNHAMLSAVLIHPDESVVFPVAVEPIVNGDGSKKNDCELCAVRRLIPQIIKALPAQKIIFGGDSLYPNAPLTREIQDMGQYFLFNIKEGYQGYPSIQFEKLSAEGKTKKVHSTDKKETRHYEFIDNLILNGQNQDLLVHFMRLTITQHKTGQTTVFEWITNIPITLDNYAMIAKIGRGRWKVENETFNTLKNQGYQFEHNFGHGKKFLASNFAILMFIAFLLDQIQLAFDKGFRRALLVAKSKKLLWIKIREIFDVVPVPDCSTLYKIITKEIKLSIQLII